MTQLRPEVEARRHALEMIHGQAIVFWNGSHWDVRRPGPGDPPPLPIVATKRAAQQVDMRRRIRDRARRGSLRHG